MAESTNCGICSGRQNLQTAVIYCHDCSEQFCETCQENHESFKVTRNHHTISIADYQKLISKIIQISDICPEHNQKYIVYCKNHLQPCCWTCAEATHKKCKDVANLEAIVKNYKSSPALQDLEASLKEYIENLTRVKTDRKNNLKTIEEDGKKALYEIENIRSKINKYLDILQDNIKAELKQKEDKTRNKISESLTLLYKDETFIGENLQMLTNVRKYAPDLQTFLYSSKLESQVHAIETRLHELSWDTFKIHIEFEPSVNKFMDQIKRFGEVEVSTTPSSVVLRRKKEEGAQFMISRPLSRQIENINLTVDETIYNIGSPCHGCCILTDGRMVFTNYFNDAIKIMKPNGTEEVSIKTSGGPIEVTQVNDKTLAFSCSSGIQLIDINRREVAKSLLRGRAVVHGITVHDEVNLIYCKEGAGIRKVRITDGTITDIVKENLPYNCFVTSFGDTVIHTNKNTNTVTCHDINGEKKWIFKDESVLRGPRGITNDSNGNLYVAGYGSDNVVIISADGQYHKEVKCGLNDIWSLHYNKVNDKLLVAQLGYGKAVIMKQN